MLVAVELRKLLGLPSSRIGLAFGLFGPLAIGAVSAPGPGSHTATDVAFIELGFGVVCAILLGVVSLSSEYRTDGEEAAATRQIVTSLTAIPSRGRFMAAKAGALALTVATVAILVTTLMLVLTGVPWSAGVAWRAVGVVVYWVLTALIALAVTMVTRSGVLPLVVLILNASVISFGFLLSQVLPAANYLPDLAGQRMFLRGPSAFTMTIPPLTGGLVMAGWTVVLLAAGWSVFRRRDA